jgi:methyltransferase
MSALVLILSLVAVARLAELAWADHNTQRLLEQGGIEVAPGHYRLMIALHLSWLVAMILVIPPGSRPIPWLLALFGVLTLGRLWVITSLGPYWTTRIITLPGYPLVRRGPYRFIRHPNYLVVAGEIATLPLAFGAWRLALGFSILNALLLAWRIHNENKALAPRRAL